MPRSRSTPPARVLYTLDREHTYHFVTLVLLALAGIVTWLAGLLTRETMLHELGSVAIGRMVQAGWFVLGAGPLLAWLWWSRRYVRRLTWLATEEQVELERFTYFGRRTWRLPVTAFLGQTGHAGDATIPGVPAVHAPYRRLRIAGLPPLILDRQGTTHDDNALTAILNGKNPDRPDARR